jgi:large repetitive protein
MRKIIFLFLGYLFLISPNVLRAQATQWPWDLVGVNFQITDNLEGDYSPAIASNGNLYLVVWYKKTPGGFDIYGARISRNGKVLGEEKNEILICDAVNDQMFPVVSWDGENFFVVWQDRRSGRRWDIYGARVTPDGEVLDGPRVTPDGKVLQPGGIPISIGKLTHDQVAPAISFDGENYLIAWQGKRNAKTRNIYFRMVPKELPEDGLIPEENPIIQLVPSLKDQASPAVAFDGENYMIVWQDKRSGNTWDIYRARVTRSGEPLDKGGIPISPISEELKGESDKLRPVLSWDGEFFLVIWMVTKKRKWSLEGKRLTADGKLVDIIDLSIQKDATNKAFPVVLWDGEEYLLVWEDEPEADPKIFGASVMPQYKPFVISESVQISFPDVKDPSYPAISRLGSEALVVWQGKGAGDYWQIYGQRLRQLETF